MKKLSAISFQLSAFLLASLAAAQEPDCFKTFHVTAAARAVTFDNRLHGCTAWTAVYSATGFSAVTVKVERSADVASLPGSWAEWSTGSVATSTTGGVISVGDFWPWVSVNVTSVTGSGSITGALYGWRTKAPGAVSPVTALASAARTETTASGVFKNPGYRGIRVYLSVTAASGTGGLTVIVRAVEPVSGAKVDLNAGGAAVTTAVKRMYEVYPSAAAASGFVQDAISRQLPGEFDVVVSHGDATSYTYSLAFEFLP